MSLLEWVFDNLYIVAVIGFALFSLLGKAAKAGNPNKKGSNTGMPTFGGRGDSDWNRQNSPQQATGSQSSKDARYEDERYDDEYENERYDDYHEEQRNHPATSTGRSNDFGGHLSQGMESSLDEQMMEIERQQRLVQERMDRIASVNTAAVNQLSVEQKSAEAGQPVLRREDIRNGILWAEVLGPPRSKQPFGTRGKL